MRWKRFAYHMADIPIGSAPVVDPQIPSAGGGDNTPKDPVPYDRFAEVNEDRKVLRTDRDQLTVRLQEENQARIRAEDRVKELEKTPGNGGGDPISLGEPLVLPDAPEGLDGRAKVAHYIQHGVAAAMPKLLPGILKEMGLDPSRLKQAAEHMPGVVESQAEVAWKSACDEVGIDASVDVVKVTFKGLMADGKMEPMEALKWIAEKIPKAKATPVEAPATQINRGALSNFSTEKIFPKNAMHATELAHAGKRVPDYSLEEIFDMSDERRSKKG